MDPEGIHRTSTTNVCSSSTNPIATAKNSATSAPRRWIVAGWEAAIGRPDGAGPARPSSVCSQAIKVGRPAGSDSASRALLFDLGGLSDAIAEVVELGPTDVAPSDDLG